MIRTVPPPDPATWDYAHCPDDEIRLCLYYEIARKSVAVKQYMGSETYLNNPVSAHSLGSKHIAFVCPEFPDTPWLGIGLEARKARLQAAEKADARWRGDDGLVIPNYELYEFVQLFAEDFSLISEFETDEDPLPPIGLRSLPEQKTTLAAIRIDWSKSEATLKREFADLLKGLKVNFSTKPTGRKNHRDLLSGLAAKTLRDHCKLHKLPSPRDAAIAMWTKHSSKTCPYSDTQAMSRAIARSQSLVETMYRLVGGQDDRLDGTEKVTFLSVSDI